MPAALRFLPSNPRKSLYLRFDSVPPWNAPRLADARATFSPDRSTVERLGLVTVAFSPPDRATVARLASLALVSPTPDFVHRGPPCASLAESLDGDDANMLTRIGHLIVDHAEALEERRARLFHKLHKPLRETS